MISVTTRTLIGCSRFLTRENVMKRAANLKDLHIPCLLPGIKTNTSPSDFAPLDQLRLMKFEGERWHLFGDTISSELSERAD
jgi:branched-chain amino acid transport system substrate-binding protein